MIKMNLFYILGRLQGHSCLKPCQLCQIWLRRYWIILCFEHVLWMPCRYNTFDGRLLWFDGVEGKRGLTLTGLFVCCCCCCCFLGGGGIKLFHCIIRTGVYGKLCAWQVFVIIIFPRYSQWSRRQCGLTSFANCHLWPQPALIVLPTTKTPSIFIFLSRRLLHCVSLATCIAHWT